MLEIKDDSIADSVKYSTFSGTMVLALVFHFGKLINFIYQLFFVSNNVY